MIKKVIGVISAFYFSSGYASEIETISTDSLGVSRTDVDIRQDTTKIEENRVEILTSETGHIGTTHYDPFGDSDEIAIILDELSSEFCYPYPGDINSRYGLRNGKIHSGIDIKVPYNDTIRCVLPGVVRMSRYYTGYGNLVVVRHHNGLESVYSHNSLNLVSAGDEVSSGTPLALAGRTGRATGVHLHFEFRLMGQYFDPEIMLDTRNRRLHEGDTVYLSRPGSGMALAMKSASRRQIAEAKSEIERNIVATGGVHTVAKGDNLYRIAIRYGTTIDNLCRMNDITRTSILSLGQLLKIH